MTRDEDDVSNVDRVTVSRWECPTCGKNAVKIKNRWVIVHKLTCAEQVTPEDVGPVTSVNDPDNAYFIVDD